MQPLEPKLILVPADFSDTAAHALRYASALGERFGAHLLVVYADSFAPPVDLATSAPSVVTKAEMIELTRLQLAAFARRNINARVTYETRVVVRGATEAIIDEAQASGANLIVMGTHGRTGVRRLLFGSVTEAVMQAAHVPVIAVNESTAETGAVGKVLCPVHFTPECREALRSAAALVDRRASPLVLFRSLAKGREDLSTSELVRLHQWVPPEVVDRCELKIIPLSPDADQIVGLAETTHADLIALGIPTERTFGESLRGTVAERIVQHSHCPVLTVNSFSLRLEGTVALKGNTALEGTTALKGTAPLKSSELGSPSRTQELASGV
jgi:nucleotide-binding universal stress UspA family protein